MSDKIIHINNEDSEADTCRKEVLPILYESLWTDDLILGQRTFTDGKIIVIGRKAKRKKAKRFDYLLRYSQNFPIAIVESKKKYKSAGDGMQQAKDYAQILGLKFAYSTNGSDILEFDFITGIEKKISSYPLSGSSRHPSKWDQTQCQKTDQATAALIKDLKQRDLLEDTFLVLAEESGRTVNSQGTLSPDNYGRDHHPRCFTKWMQELEQSLVLAMERPMISAILWSKTGICT